MDSFGCIWGVARDANEAVEEAFEFQADRLVTFARIGNHQGEPRLERPGQRAITIHAQFDSSVLEHGESAWTWL